ncbi:hypothetical protein OROGR_002689 [Orobanche gracilis]
MNRHESFKDYETAGSISSNPRILIKFPRMPEKVVEPPPTAEDAAEIFRVEEKKSYYCKECNKNFSSGKGLGGHMSSAHVQANKDHSSCKKLKSKMATMKAQCKYSGPSYSGSGLEDNLCAVCGKRFPSQKSLYGHMRCHPDREWRGMGPPPVERRMEWSEASIESGFRCTGRDQEGGEYDDSDSGPDVVPRTAVFLDTLKGWSVKAKRGRSARVATVSPPKDPRAPSSEEEEALSAGHELLRLLKRNLDSVKQIGGEVDQGMTMRTELDGEVNFKKHSLARQGPELDVDVSFKKHPLARQGPELDADVNFKKHSLARQGPELDVDVSFKKHPLARLGEESDGEVGFKKHPLGPRAPESDGGDNFKKHERVYDHPTKKQIVCRMEVTNGTESGTGDWKKTREYKRRKLTPRTPTMKIWDTNAMDDGRKMPWNADKGKGRAEVPPESRKKSRESEEQLLFGALSVLANGRREISQHQIPTESKPAATAVKLSRIRPKDDSGLSSPEKHTCTTCNKVFTSHQALGGHRSSHNKFKMTIVNTIDSYLQDTKPKIMTVRRKNDVERRQSGQCSDRCHHKKCHNDDDNNKGEEKVVRGFDLNMMPDENGAAVDIQDKHIW